VRLLGRGGLGEVYLAHDGTLDRDVAIKFVAPEKLADADARRRLLREARAAAALDHPGICTVYETGQTGDGRSYIVMQYVEGETLASALGRGPLSVRDTLVLCVEMAEALGAAHRRGVVHRDLKPSNVMVTPSGHAKLVDFGIAKIVQTAAQRGDAPTTTVTTTAHSFVGSPGYMSPEQIQQRPLDGRSDLFSLGLVLFECLTGRRAFTGRTSLETLSNILHVHPPASSSLRPELTEGHDELCRRLLAKEPADRFQSADEVVGAIRLLLPDTSRTPAPRSGDARMGGATPVPPARAWRRPGVLAAAALLIVAAAGAVMLPESWPLIGRGGNGERRLPVVAVLPLTNLSGDRSLDYVGAGMADTMSTKLAGVRGISVVSRAEVHDALLRNAEVSKVCGALGVTYVVSGAVQQAAGRVQVTINLLSPDGRTIVSGGGRIYDDSMDHLFDLQRRIAEDLSRDIMGTLSPADRAQLARSPTVSVEAMSAYWRGRALMDKPGPEPIEPALAAFQQSVTEDPSFALGFAGLGNAYWRKYTQTKEPEWAEKAVMSTEHARQLDPEQADVRLSLATVYHGVGRADDAVSEARRALALQPASYEAHRLLGDIWSERGDIDQAVTEFGAAIRIRPDYAAGYRSLGLLQMRAARYPEAAAAFQRMAELQPDSPFPYQLLGNVHASMGDLDAAVRDYSAATARGGSFATYSSLGYVYYLNGRFEDAVRSYAKAIELRPKNATTHWNLGDAYRRLGRTVEARKAYEDAVTLFDADLRVNPKDAVAIATRATCLALLGNVQEARADVARAAQLAPGDQDVQYQRALVLTTAGDPEQAVDAVAAAVRSGYSVALLRLDRDLATLRTSTRFEALIGPPGQETRRAK
jgi:serine/threonine-protein kinase